MHDRRDVIREIVVLIARAAERERAMADHLERGIRMLRSPLLLDEDCLEAWIVQARAWVEASRRAHNPTPEIVPRFSRMPQDERAGG